MAYRDNIKISPDVARELRLLKALYGLQSHNKVLRRILGLSSVATTQNGSVERENGQ